MAWVRIDDKFYDHPKWADAPGDSIALWLAAMAWCNRNDSLDGYIPAMKLARLIAVKNAKKTAADLVARRAFDEAPSGFVIHDYAEYQQPEKVKRIRDQRSENGKKGAASRWQKPCQVPSDSQWQKNGSDPVPVDDDDSSSNRAAEVVAKALEAYADIISVGKDNPPGYAARVVANGESHRVKLTALLKGRPDATPDELAQAHKAGGWPRPQAVNVVEHPDTCVCDGTGRVLVDPNDESRSAPVKPCPVTEWPDATVHQLRGAS